MSFRKSIAVWYYQKLREKPEDKKVRLTRIDMMWLLVCDAVPMILFAFGLCLPHSDSLTLVGKIGLFGTAIVFLILILLNYRLWKKQQKG